MSWRQLREALDGLRLQPVKSQGPQSNNYKMTLSANWVSMDINLPQLSLQIKNSGQSTLLLQSLGLPRWYSGENILLPMQKTQGTRVWSLGQEDPRRRKWQSAPVLLPGKSHGQKSLVAYSQWDHKELDMTEWTHTHTHTHAHTHRWPWEDPPKLNRDSWFTETVRLKMCFIA